MKFDKSFFEPEERAGWPVSTETKKVWAVQLDLLCEFDRVCKKNGLRWYPVGGALIGVIRHQGFIPWDDDVDVMMPREDYDKFLKICQKEFKDPYFLQTTLNEEQCYMFWVSLRNSNTTGNRATCMTKKQNNGIAIDIMPLEGCEDSLLLYKIRRLPLRILSVLCNTYVNEFNMSKKAVILRKILRMFKLNYKKIYCMLEKHNSKHPMEKYNNVTLTLVADPIARDIRHVIWKKEDFASTIDMKFENITIPVPVGYDRILRTEYGNYMEFPPVEKRVAKHDMIFAPDIPYKQYCAEHYGMKYE